MINGDEDTELNFIAEGNVEVELLSDWTTIYYSTDRVEWRSLRGPIQLSNVPTYFRNDCPCYCNPGSGECSRFVFSGDGEVTVSGNIMSLISSENFNELTTINAENCFKQLFSNCTKIKSANILLPATEIESGCYQEMFSNCKSMIIGPQYLPATELKSNCYREMFHGCESLLETPSFVVEKVSPSCCKRMFEKCLALKGMNVELPAMQLKYECYEGMFSTCLELTDVPELPATEIATECYMCMFDACAKLSVAQEILPATELVKGCYDRMFSGCTDLTKAPILPAEKMEPYCYYDIFFNCNNLKEVSCYATTNLDANSAFEGWSNLMVESLYSPLSKIEWGDKIPTGTNVIKSYVVTLNSNDDSVNSTFFTTDPGGKITGDLPTLERLGFIFDGWYSLPEGGEKIVSTTTFTENKVIFAHWTSNKVTVTFDANGGDGTMSRQTIIYGSDDMNIISNKFTKSESQFLVWLTDDGKVINDGQSMKEYLEQNPGETTITLHAQWTGSPVPTPTPSSSSSGIDTFTVVSIMVIAVIILSVAIMIATKD